MSTGFDANGDEIFIQRNRFIRFTQSNGNFFERSVLHFDEGFPVSRDVDVWLDDFLDFDLVTQTLGGFGSSQPFRGPVTDARTTIGLENMSFGCTLPGVVHTDPGTEFLNYVFGGNATYSGPDMNYDLEVVHREPFEVGFDDPTPFFQNGFRLRGDVNYIINGSTTTVAIDEFIEVEMFCRTHRVTTAMAHDTSADYGFERVQVRIEGAVDENCDSCSSLNTTHTLNRSPDVQNGGLLPATYRKLNASSCSPNMNSIFASVSSNQSFLLSIDNGIMADEDAAYFGVIPRGSVSGVEFELRSVARGNRDDCNLDNVRVFVTLQDLFKLN